MARVKVIFPVFVFTATRWRRDDDRPLVEALAKGHAQHTPALLAEARFFEDASDTFRWLDVADDVVADAKASDEYDWRRVLGLWVLIGSGALEIFRSDGGKLSRFDIINGGE